MKNNFLSGFSWLGALKNFQRNKKYLIQSTAILRFNSLGVRIVRRRLKICVEHVQPGPQPRKGRYSKLWEAEDY